MIDPTARPPGSASHVPPKMTDFTCQNQVRDPVMGGRKTCNRYVGSAFLTPGSMLRFRCDKCNTSTIVYGFTEIEWSEMTTLVNVVQVVTTRAKG